MTDFRAALGKEILEQWRTYRMLIVVAVLTIFGLTSPLIAKYSPEMIRLLPNGDQISELIPEPTAADSVAQYLKNGTQFGILLALLMGMGSVSLEKDKGTAALMLSKPLSRGAFLWAKFAALAITFGIGIAISGAAGYLYTWIIFESLEIGAWVGMNLLLYLFLLVFLSITLFSSTLTSSQVLSGGAAFGLMLILSSLGAFPVIGEYFPAQLTRWGTALVLGENLSSWPAIASSVSLILISLLGGQFIFGKQEL
jgi:ABC-2 type transport system permease protein